MGIMITDNLSSYVLTIEYNNIALNLWEEIYQVSIIQK